MNIKKNQNKPFGIFEFILAFKYIKGKKNNSFFSIISSFSFLGIMLGVTTLVIVMSAMNGFRSELISKILDVNGHIILYKNDSNILNYKNIIKSINNIKGVISVIPVINGQVLASGINQNIGVIVKGISKKDILNRQLITKKIIFGNLNNFNNNKIAIGINMSKKLNIHIGDQIRLISSHGVITPFGISPRQKNYIITAIFEIGEFQFDNQIILMPFYEAQLFFNKEKNTSIIEIITKNPDKIKLIKKEINQILQKNNIKLFITDWQEKNSTFFNALMIERNVMFLILMLIIIIASFNIISSMIMMVKDKTHDIAIMRTIGARRSSIQRIFFITGGIIGISGTLVGSLIGIIICLYIENIQKFIFKLTETIFFSPELYFLSKIPIKMEINEIITIIIVSIILSLLATIYPCFKAAKIDPVKSLRFK